MTSKVEEEEKDDDEIHTVPKLVDYGLVIMHNFAFVNKEITKLCGYYIIPKYQVNLNQYMK